MDDKLLKAGLELKWLEIQLSGGVLVSSSALGSVLSLVLAKGKTWRWADLGSWLFQVTPFCSSFTEYELLALRE